jgi:pSer/pThr/pTyr-binding forkhead associated (FHA) protein
MSQVAPQLTKGVLRISRIHRGEEWKQTFYRSSIVLGRATSTGQPDFDLSPDTNVSRNHARIWIEDGSCWIEDLGTKFGTQVEGADIRAIGKVRLDAASRIKVGDTILQVDSHIDKASSFAELAQQPPMAATIEIEKTISTSPGNGSLPRSSALDALDRQALLLEILVQFSLPSPLDQLLKTIIGRVVELVPGSMRGTLLLLDPAKDRLLLAAFVSPSEPAVSETLARRALKQQQAFVWRNKFGTDPALSIQRHQIQSGMYAPLIHDGRPLGVLCVDNPDLQSAFSDNDLQLLVAVADHAAVAVSHHQLRVELSQKSVLLEAFLSNFSPSERKRLTEKSRLERSVCEADKSNALDLEKEIQELLSHRHLPPCAADKAANAQGP